MKFEPLTTTAGTRRSFEEEVDRLSTDSTFTCPRDGGGGGSFEPPDDDDPGAGLPKQDVRQRLEKMLRLEVLGRPSPKEKGKVFQAGSGRTSIAKQDAAGAAATGGGQDTFTGKKSQSNVVGYCADNMKVSLH